MIFIVAPLIVIPVVCVALVEPKFCSRCEQAPVTKAQTDVAAFRDALEVFKEDNGRYPTMGEGLGALVTPPPNLPHWQKMLDEVRTDPWEQPYIYRQPGVLNPGSYDLISMGKDGRLGTDDDITNAAAAAN